MAKGDQQKMQNQVNTQVGNAQNSQNQNTNTLNDAQKGFAGNYNTSAGKDQSAYDQIMGNYQSLYNDPYGNGGQAVGGYGGPVSNFDDEYGLYKGLTGGNFYGMNPEYAGALSKSIGGFGNFADTGGYSSQDLQDMRARGVAPVRATYQNAQNELQRSRNLGGNSPNFASAQARMARDQAIQTGDALTNVNAGIANQVQQGKLAGLQGLVSAGGTGQGLQNSLDSLNGQLMLSGIGGMTNIDQARNSAAQAAAASQLASQQAFFNDKMGATAGMTNLYGTTPAATATTGNQLLTADQQLLGNQQNQNQIGQMGINGQYQTSQIPGNFKQAIGNIGSVVGLGSQIAGGIMGVMGGLGKLPGGKSTGGFGMGGVPNTGGFGGVNMMGGNPNLNPFQQNPFQQNPGMYVGGGTQSPFQNNPFGTGANNSIMGLYGNQSTMPSPYASIYGRG